MPKKAKELSAVEVRRIEHSGRGRLNETVAVGGVPGLLLQVTPTSAKTWLLRTKVGARRREIGLGGYPEVPLAQARDKAREARELIRSGVDPVEQRKTARAALIAQQKRGVTFTDAVDRYLASKLDEFSNDKHRKQWRSTLDTYANPAIGKMLVADIEMQDVLRVLNQETETGGTLWLTKTETAKRLRGRIENILSWATVSGHRKGDNPARWKGNLSEVLPKPSKVAKGDNQPSLSQTDLPKWFAALRQREGMATRALEFLTLCAARSGEVRGATWSEIDLKARMWVIPAARMKMDREHRVPLSDAAVDLLEATPRMDRSEFVFPAVRGGALSDMSLSAVMRRMQEAEVKAGRAGWLDPSSGRAAVPHGLRSAFRVWTADRGYERDMAELALAHLIGSEVERAYQRSDMVERRRAMMGDWSAFLSGASFGSNVVQIGQSKS